MILTYLLLTSFHNFSLSQTDQSSYFCHLSKRREIWRNIMAALAEEMQFANKLDQNQQPSSLTSAATAQQPKKKKTKLKVRSKSNPVMDASFLLRVFVVVYRYFVMFYDMIIFLYLWVLFLSIYYFVEIIMMVQVCMCTWTLGFESAMELVKDKLRKAAFINFFFMFDYFLKSVWALTTLVLNTRSVAV